MAGKKKPFVSVEVECPGCHCFLNVNVHRKRINPVEPPIYEYETDVLLQENLFKNEETNSESSDNVDVEV